MYYYSFKLCSIEKSKVGNNLIMSWSISMGENNLSGVHSLETHNFSVLTSFECIVFSLCNLNKYLISTI